MSNVLEKVSDVLFGKQEAPALPEAKEPAVPAPSRRTDTGAKVVIGADAGKDKRASGKGTGTSSGDTGGDVLGNLGRGGLSI